MDDLLFYWQVQYRQDTWRWEVFANDSKLSTLVSLGTAPNKIQAVQVAAHVSELIEQLHAESDISKVCGHPGSIEGTDPVTFFKFISEARKSG